VLFGLFDWNWVEGNANTYCSWDAPDEPPSCAGHKAETGLIHQAHSAGVEVYPSIGGWTLSDPFSKLAESPEARRNFAANCVKLIIAYDFDGIDIDWEYPGYAPHLGRDVDTINYNLFLKEIRDALDELGYQTGQFYGLTAALPCGPTIIDNIQIDVVNDLLTEFNLMTYDFHGSWNPTTGVNAPLYDQDGSEDFSVHACAQTWMKGGARPEQINIGLPFYGRSFAGTGLTGIGQSHSGDADLVAWSLDEGSPQFFNIMEKISGFTSVRDEQTKTQLAYNYAGFLSYDDERAICDKCEYAVDHGLNGYIIWEISGDLMPDLSQPLLQACNDRINDLSKRCDKSETLDPGSNGKWHESTDGDPFYPHSKGYCLDDGNHWESFIDLSQMFVSADACCDAIFSYKSDCLTTSLDPPAADVTVSVMTTPSPTTLFPTYSPSLFPTNAPVEAPKEERPKEEVPTEEPPTYVSPQTEGLFYPHYTIDGASADCHNDGNAPSWISASMMTVDKFECCTTYFFPSWSDLCISDNDQHPYYPDYNNMSCRNDGSQPSWMVGDYLNDYHVLCCDTHFGHDENLLSGCIGF